MHPKTVLALSMLCSACLEPRDCVELYTCPEGGETTDAVSAADAGIGSDADAAGPGTPATESTAFDSGSPATSDSDATMWSADASASVSSPSDAEAPVQTGDSSSPGEPGDASGPVGSAVVVQVVTGGSHTCALLSSGKVRCWGDSSRGQLGYGNTNTVGDDEVPASAGEVVIGGTVVSMAAGGAHTCAILDTGSVRCWGDASHGQLGYGNTNNIGDNEAPISAGDVDVGGRVVSVTAGTSHTCAVLEAGNVRCWGDGADGRLGYADVSRIGDDESPSSAGDVDLGGPAANVSAGGSHSCALMQSGHVRCWGYGFNGALGYGNTTSIGDDEPPSEAGDVNVGGALTQVSAASSFVCGLTEDQKVRCWGASGYGQLGYGNGEQLGDDESPIEGGDLDLGANVSRLSQSGGDHICALLVNGRLRCWGRGEEGQLGYAGHDHIGDDETPGEAGDVNVGAAVAEISAGGYHSCAILDEGQVRCWGAGASGALGYGNVNSVGRDDHPANAGDVVVTW